jgi:NAD(P)-dependent dehydrogenase (short-subunit alcohol dehydrogenase family)
MSELKNYSNKLVAVVPGSNRGIGKAIAIEFVKAGYFVVINARNDEELKYAAEEISKIAGGNITNDKIFKVVGDVSQEPACISLIQETVKRFGRIDALVNNAGISEESKRISELTSVDWDKVLDTNLKVHFFVPERR